MMRALQITTLSDREIVMTREFDAPRHLVWRAMTEPDLIKRWLGVHNGWVMAVCEMGTKPGDPYRWVWRGPDGTEMGMGGVILEIAAPERLVATERFDQSWYPGEAVDTTVLVERDGRTSMTLTVRYDSRDARDAVLKSPMEQGMVAGYNQLDIVLASLTPPTRG